MTFVRCWLFTLCMNRNAGLGLMIDTEGEVLRFDTQFYPSWQEHMRMMPVCHVWNIVRLRYV